MINLFLIKIAIVLIINLLDETIGLALSLLCNDKGYTKGTFLI